MQIETNCLSVRPQLAKAFRQQARSIFPHRNISQQWLLVLASIGTNSTKVDSLLVDHPHQCRNAHPETTTRASLVRPPVETNFDERTHDVRLWRRRGGCDCRSDYRLGKGNVWDPIPTQRMTPCPQRARH